MGDEDYLDGGLSSQLAKDIFALQRAAYQDAMKTVLTTMTQSLDEKRRLIDSSSTLIEVRLNLSAEIDLLEKMIRWVEGQISDDNYY